MLIASEFRHYEFGMVYQFTFGLKSGSEYILFVFGGIRRHGHTPGHCRCTRLRCPRLDCPPAC